MKLARFEYKGSSQGWWIVQSLPGVTIYRTQAGWEINNDPAIFEGFQEVADKIWGENWQTTDLGPGFLTYPTRSQALGELKNYFSPEPQPEAALPELLG